MLEIRKFVILDKCCLIDHDIFIAEKYFRHIDYQNLRHDKFRHFYFVVFRRKFYRNSSLLKKLTTSCNVGR